MNTVKEETNFDVLLLVRHVGHVDEEELFVESLRVDVEHSWLHIHALSQPDQKGIEGEGDGRVLVVHRLLLTFRTGHFEKRRPADQLRKDRNEGGEQNK